MAARIGILMQPYAVFLINLLTQEELKFLQILHLCVCGWVGGRVTQREREKEREREGGRRREREVERERWRKDM